MKIIDVIPITKGLKEETFSYFTSKPVREGTLVNVPSRSRIITALVTSVREAETEKINLKSADFKLRPIKSIVSDNLLSPFFIEGMRETAKYYASPLGQVIRDFLPEAVLSEKQPAETRKEKKENQGNFSISLVQAPTAERIQSYRTIIREEFARGHSVFILFPTVSTLKEFTLFLEKGIEDYTHALHSQITAKNIRDSWKKAIIQKHPILILGTRPFLSIPKNYNTLIIEGESSGAHRSQSRPYVDTRRAGEFIAKNLNIRLIFGDIAIRTETFYREESGEMLPAILSPSRLLSEANQEIVDMKKEKDGSKKTFSVVSPELQNLIADARSLNEHVVIFVNRRGLSTAIVCHDCYKTLICDKCSAPLVTHKGEQGQNLLCHKCLEEKNVPDECPYCGSWNMRSYGIGIDTVRNALLQIFPTISIFKIDGDTIKTQKQGENIIESFLKNPGSILIGTEMIFSFIKEPVERVVVASIDTLFAFPDFNMNEKIFQLLIRLRLFAKKTFVIQTRLRENPVFDYALRGNISGFYREEVEERKSLGYPPFKQLIKLSCASEDKKKLKEEIDVMTKDLSVWEPIPYTAFMAKIKGLYTSHILLKLQAGRWPNKEPGLYEKLRNLPSSWKIDIDPESLL